MSYSLFQQYFFFFFSFPLLWHSPVMALVSRVKTHLELYYLHRQLQQHTEHLEELGQARTQELTETHARLQFLDQRA